MNQDEEVKKTTVTDGLKWPYEILTHHLSNLLNDAGKAGTILLGIAIVTALYRKFLPEIDSDLAPFFTWVSPNVAPSSIITMLSIGSAALFFIVLIVPPISKSLIRFLIAIFLLLMSVLNFFTGLIIRILYIFSEPSARKVSTFLFSLKYTVFFKELWLADSKIERKELEIPVKLKKFQSIRAEVKVIHVSGNHWRAGVIFHGPKKEQYIFHVHEDSNQPGVLKTRILRRVPGEEDEDKISTLQDIMNIRNIDLEVKKGSDTFEFYINKTKAGEFKVALVNIDSLHIAAWADDKPFRIEFRNIKAVS